MDNLTEDLLKHFEEERMQKKASKRTMCALHDAHFKKISEQLIPLLEMAPIFTVYEFLINEGKLPNWYRYEAFYRRVKKLQGKK